LNATKQTYIIAFALFSLFFGAGNLILPPNLGNQAGSEWQIVALGFICSAVIIPIMAIYGHAKLQGNLADFAKKISPRLAVFYALLIYLISISLPAPRTASVTHEMAIQPYFDVSPWITSSLYFGGVLIFSFNRTRILSLIGKYLTPIILVLLFLIIIFGLLIDLPASSSSNYSNTFSAGILEGYQTFDAIGGVVVGGVIVVSLFLQGTFNYREKKKMIIKAGILAGLGLLIVYTGLIALGAHYSSVEVNTRVNFLNFLSTETLGSYGTLLLGVLVSLACFTTAVGIVTGTGDYVQGLFKKWTWVYKTTIISSCLIGVLMGQLDVSSIIDIAYPALLLIYPITIVLILLNVISENWSSSNVFIGVVCVTLLFSLPDFLGYFLEEENLELWFSKIPLASEKLGWVIPALISFFVINLFEKKNQIFS